MPKAVLLDIEGTTTSIAFVKDRLFPFAAEALDGFLATHGDAPAVREILAEVQRAAPAESPAETLRGWMAADAKVTPLKALQGLIWHQGYADGRLKGHLWPDVAACLRAWAAGGVRLAIYSSGSVEAQRDLFGHSEAGDLTPLLAGFFDTRIGAKREAASYAAIAAALQQPPGEILFLSDVAEELDAAREAGLLTCQLVRPADGTRPAGRHPEAAAFPEVAARFGLPR
ncbi:enolase-phosphatase E1 [Siccirubricoccus deserti]|uniref:Enolase-phosphatase E1 n=1 Tax=Siccirubricoccus deserti TaxID=2013562 RepID=A0A9X0QUI9_9PROT|nr:acireductone synthase [Siccirubricoccus deserti]MBC4014044.1 acireductone synthase [Siccirubricoccus deserti]GGC26029.1 enolase-phosphatase E1 [Siccirubricoccus deserti]